MSMATAQQNNDAAISDAALRWSLACSCSCICVRSRFTYDLKSFSDFSRTQIRWPWNKNSKMRKLVMVLADWNPLLELLLQARVRIENTGRWASLMQRKNLFPEGSSEFSSRSLWLIILACPRRSVTRCWVSRKWNMCLRGFDEKDASLFLNIVW